MTSPDAILIKEFNTLSEMAEKEKISWEIRKKIREIRKSINDNHGGRYQTATLNTRLVYFNDKIKQLLKINGGTNENPNEEYIKERFKGYVTRKIMLYLIKHINEEKHLREISKETGLTIRQLYDIKNTLVKKLINENHPFVLDTQRVKHGIYKLIEKSRISGEHQYKKNEIENCATWTSKNFQGATISKITTTLAENLGKWVSIKKIAKFFSNLPPQHLSTYICRLTVRLRKGNRLYLIEKKYGKYRLVKNKNLSGPLMDCLDFKKWIYEVSQKDSINLQVGDRLGQKKLKQKTKISDIQNEVMGMNPSKNVVEISEKIGEFIIKLCEKSHNKYFRAVVNKGYIAIYLAEELQQKNTEHDRASCDDKWIHISLRKKGGGSIKPLVY